MYEQRLKDDYRSRIIGIWQLKMKGRDKDMLSGKVAIITGGGSGIGNECARLFAEQHATVIIIGRNATKIEGSARVIDPEGKCVYGRQCDVSKSEEVDELTKWVKEKFGRIDILVNNAALFLPTDILREELQDEWGKMIDVNIKGMIRMIHRCVPFMVNNKGGCIVNLSSVDAFAGCLNYAGYSMTKGAVVSLTRGLALDLGRYNIRVNAVAPGITDTPMTHERIEENKDKYLNRLVLKRIGKDTDIANAVLFLSSELSSYITGEVINVNGGLQFV